MKTAEYLSKLERSPFRLFVLPSASLLQNKLKPDSVRLTWNNGPRASWLRALRALGLLYDGVVVLWLILSHRRLCLAEHGRSTPQGSQQELPRRHQVAVALGM